MAACAEFLPTSFMSVRCNGRGHGGAILEAFIGKSRHVEVLVPTGMQLLGGHRSWLSKPVGE